ncbi:acid phosphatase, class B-like protein [Artemisia annua]|uniref:Acid phosphatase, class B-like protein n=2 Tax=Artemisia annua TaxID=35608 RepID=A0A2U1N269_ARTAN|nr:acid phosphatase, class B-like protein [Artemisia annua]
MGFTFFLLILTITNVAASRSPFNQIHLLMPHSGSAGLKHPDLDCLSWRLAVEVHNIQNWKQVPGECKTYVEHYMLGEQYRKDFDIVTEEAYKYAKGLNITKDGKDIWVFDIDETSLSNLRFWASDNAAFGTIPLNITLFVKWVEEETAPAIPGALKLYKQLIELGFKIVFMTGLDEAYGEIRSKNMKYVGYTTWEKIIYNKASEGSGVVYKQAKRKELEEVFGYRIRGNVGDQWSDLLGTNPGDRTFKVPNPMYYVA